MTDCIPYKIQVTSVGVSTDLFEIKYSLVGSSTLYTASATCGDAATNLTADQILNGYTVCLPANVSAIYVCDIGGVCNGRCTLIYIVLDCDLAGNITVLDCNLAGTITTLDCNLAGTITTLDCNLAGSITTLDCNLVGNII